MEYRHSLRIIREQYDLSIDDLAEKTTLSRRTILRAEQGHAIHPSSRRILCGYFSKLSGRTITSQELGLLAGGGSHERAQNVSTTGAVETDMDQQRRKFLLQVLGIASTALALPSMNLDTLERIASVLANPTKVDEPTLEYLENVIDSCWRLSNESGAAEVEKVLPLYLPQLVTLAHQPSKYQQKAAHLASQGYILAAEVDHGNVNVMKAYCQQAVLYSQVAESHDIQVGALKQQATIFLVGKEPAMALQKYLEATPFVSHISPLLHSRVYLGLASASARCGEKQNALRYLGLAHESFPEYPENDPNYLYTICSKPVLHLYEALTYTDLHQPQDAWQSLIAVNGLQPKMSVSESTRIEFINLQAKTAAILGDMEQSRTYLLASVNASNAQGYNLWLSEAYDVYKAIVEIWPNESPIKALGDLFHSFSPL